MSSILGESIPLQSPPFGGLPNRLWMVATICPVMWYNLWFACFGGWKKMTNIFSKWWWTIKKMSDLSHGRIRKKTLQYLLPYPNSAVNQLLKTPPTATTDCNLWIFRQHTWSLDMAWNHGNQTGKVHGRWLQPNLSRLVPFLCVFMISYIYIYTVCILLAYICNIYKLMLST